jgi:hypothetical protein
MLPSINAMQKKANMCNFLAFLSTLVLVQNVSRRLSIHSCNDNDRGDPNTWRIIIPSSISSAANSTWTYTRLRGEQQATMARLSSVFWVSLNQTWWHNDLAYFNLTLVKNLEQTIYVLGQSFGVYLKRQKKTIERLREGRRCPGWD